jgi:hypothetical protein
MRLPIYQVCESQPWPTQLFIQPDTEVMQGHLRRQAYLKPTEVMGPFTIKAERMLELLIHGLDDLTHPGQPAPEPLGPRPSAIALRRADHLGPISLPPRRMMGLALKVLIDHIRPQSGSSLTRQPRMGIAAQGQEGRGQGLILRAGHPHTKAGDHSLRVSPSKVLMFLVTLSLPEGDRASFTEGQRWRCR